MIAPTRPASSAAWRIDEPQRRVLRVMPARGAQRHALEEALASVGHPSSYPQR